MNFIIMNPIDICINSQFDLWFIIINLNRNKIINFKVNSLSNNKVSFSSKGDNLFNFCLSFCRVCYIITSQIGHF